MADGVVCIAVKKKDAGRDDVKTIFLFEIGTERKGRHENNSVVELETLLK